MQIVFISIKESWFMQRVKSVTIITWLIQLYREQLVYAVLCTDLNHEKYKIIVIVEYITSNSKLTVYDIYYRTGWVRPVLN